MEPGFQYLRQCPVKHLDPVRGPAPVFPGGVNDPLTGTSTGMEDPEGFSRSC